MARDKKFLNDSHEEFGSIAWYVKPSKSFFMSSVDECGAVDSNLRLTDCGHNIVLEFSAYKYKDVKKRVDKLDALIESLQEFREAYVEQLKEIKFKK